MIEHPNVICRVQRPDTSTGTWPHSYNYGLLRASRLVSDLFVLLSARIFWQLSQFFRHHMDCIWQHGHSTPQGLCTKSMDCIQSLGLCTQINRGQFTPPPGISMLTISSLSSPCLIQVTSVKIRIVGRLPVLVYSNDRRVSGYRTICTCAYKLY